MDKTIREIILSGLEEKLPSLHAARSAARVPARGWLRAVREAIGLTQSGVAARAAMKRQSYSQFELSEERGSISIASLIRAAGAMDCDLVYFILPRETVARTYSELADLRDPVGGYSKAEAHSATLRTSARGETESTPPGAPSS